VANIQKAWKATGLNPWNPDTVMEQLPKRVNPNSISNPRPQTPKLTYTAENGECFQAILTPANVAEVGELVQQVLEGEFHPAIALQIQKLSKVASKAMANAITQSVTNSELLTALKHKKSRSNRSNEHYGYGRVMNLDVIKEREAKVGEKSLKVAWDALMRLGPDIFMAPAKKSSPVKLLKRGNAQAFRTAVAPYLKLSPEIFSDNIIPLTTINLTVSPTKPLMKLPSRKKVVAVPVVVPVLAPVAAPVPLQTRSGRLVLRKTKWEAL
jgi:hypothetical protein